MGERQGAWEEGHSAQWDPFTDCVSMCAIALHLPKIIILEDGAAEIQWGWATCPESHSSEGTALTLRAQDAPIAVCWRPIPAVDCAHRGAALHLRRGGGDGGGGGPCSLWPALSLFRNVWLAISGAARIPPLAQKRKDPHRTHCHVITVNCHRLTSLSGLKFPLSLSIALIFSRGSKFIYGEKEMGETS